ncbi:MAG: hypothetical protein J5721_00265, partial [Lachnospiraceae bacterium]|nr:hypothetical protein [Lachnospiraceae bacterium]
TVTTNDGGYTASCTITVTAYTARWVDADGTIYKEEQVAHGGSVIAPSGPTRESSPDKDYTFKQWLVFGSQGTTVPAGGTVSGIEEDIFFVADWTETTRKYDITWCDVNGLPISTTQIGTTQVEYGQNPTHEALSKASDAVGSYTFQGWTTTPIYSDPYGAGGPTMVYGSTSAIPAVTGDATYYACYEVDYAEYDVFFRDAYDYPLAYYQQEHYGTSIYEPDAPDTIDNGTKSFIGWRADDGAFYTKGTVPKTITGNRSYKAEYQ